MTAQLLDVSHKLVDTKIYMSAKLKDLKCVSSSFTKTLQMAEIQKSEWSKDTQTSLTVIKLNQINYRNLVKH